LQQSALEAQEVPACTHCAPVHRGTPTLSCLHVSSFSQLPEQQSHDELQDIVESLQTSPLGLHPIGKRQMPTEPPPLRSHVTGFLDPPGRPVAPQQSLSAIHKSPTGRHPLAGWQTSTPVGPHGAHARLQHGPPHRGSPPSRKEAPPSDVEPPQSCPSTRPQFADPDGAAVAHVPIVRPVGTLHVPVQQSASVAQASAGWTQNEDGSHVPAEQRPEQQPALDEHALPSVEQLELSGEHVPLAHVWLQHWPSAVQEPSSD
jgi:hypothetical protein